MCTTRYVTDSISMSFRYTLYRELSIYYYRDGAGRVSGTKIKTVRRREVKKNNAVNHG